MNSKLTMRTFIPALLLTHLAASGCGKSDDEAKAADTAQLEGTAKAEPAKLIEDIGVEPGPVQQTGGAAAVIAEATGQVEVRALGEEGFHAAGVDSKLFPGDQVRAGEGASLTVAFPDESTAQLAELSTLAIGSRAATEDPASSAAVLSGVARFSVAPRAPAEGLFIVHTPAGLVATKGTVFGVGVAADGDARVGVEQGEVEVAGAAALDAPVSLATNQAVELQAQGKVEAPAAFVEDDWGTWRDTAEANVDVSATANAHAEAMANLEGELKTTYASLEKLAAEMTTFEAQAEAAAQADAKATYEAKLPEAEATIDASFLTALRLEWLTQAYAAHAVLAADLYVRHPDMVAFAKIEPGVHAAVLWPKRFDATCALYLEPLRVSYYVHHARGRAHAQLVGVAVPSFYAQVTPPAVPSVKARGKVGFKVYATPTLVAHASARPIWIGEPSANWHAKVKGKAAAPRGKVAFWVRPPELKSKAVIGAKVRGEVSPVFASAVPTARGQLKAKAGLALGHKIKIDPPNMDAAAKARAEWKGELPTANADMHANAHAAMPEMPDVHGKAELKGKAGLKGEAALKAKAHEELKAARDAEAKVKADAHGKADAHAKAAAGMGGNLKLEAPKVEVKAPKVKAEAKGSAKLKLTN